MASERPRRGDRRKKDRMGEAQLLGIIGFGAVLGLGFLLGMLWFLRPSVSETEKRELAKFPEFTFQSFWDGSFFSDVSLWYSDTFPMRDSLISLEHKIQNCYGVTPNTMMVGGNQKGDDIPTIGPGPDGSGGGPGTSGSGSGSTSSDRSSDNSSGGTSSGGTSSSAPDASTSAGTSASQPDGSSSAPDASGSGSGSGSSSSAAPSLEPADSSGDTSGDSSQTTVEPPDSKGMNSAIQKKIQEGLYVKNGAAYSVYYFGQKNCERYAEALNMAAKKLAGRTHVYSILVPNNSGVMLPEDELEGLGGADQKQAIAYYYSLYDPAVTSVPIIDTLREHNDEYLYFRTDHHWTQLGAYYAYRNFCKAKGITPHELSQFETLTVTPFLGSFYSTLQNADMEKNPDTVTAYIPMGTNKMTFWDVDGNETPWKVITDVRKWNRGSGYSCFIGGDKPLSIIENPEIQDGSSCMVLKESYGNCFVPFLVDHYQTVYVMDFRYTKDNVVNYVKEHNIKDLIVINNITIAATSGVADRIYSLF